MAKPVLTVTGIVTNVGRFLTVLLDEYGREITIAAPIAGIKELDEVAIAVVKVESK